MRNSLNIFFFFLFFLVFSTLQTHTVYASEYAIGLYPPVIRIHQQTPGTIQTPISIENLSDSLVNLRILIKRYIPSSDTSGKISFPSDKDHDKEYDRLFEQIKVMDGKQIISDLYLAPKQQKQLFLNINLLPDQKKSEYYFSIIFITNNGEVDQLNSSAIKLGVATNVILDYQTSDTIIAAITHFSAPQFNQQGPIPFAISLKNSSQHYIMPKSFIKIYDVFGNQIDTLRLSNIIIPANTSRHFANTDNAAILWDKSALLGTYTATLQIALSPKGPVLIKSIRFISLPYSFIVLILFCLIFILVVTIRFKTKKGDFR